MRCAGPWVSWEGAIPQRTGVASSCRLPCGPPYPSLTCHSAQTAHTHKKQTPAAGAGKCNGQLRWHGRMRQLSEPCIPECQTGSSSCSLGPTHRSEECCRHCSSASSPTPIHPNTPHSSHKKCLPGACTAAQGAVKGEKPRAAGALPRLTNP